MIIHFCTRFNLIMQFKNASFADVSFVAEAILLMRVFLQSVTMYPIWILIYVRMRSTILLNGSWDETVFIRGSFWRSVGVLFRILVHLSRSTDVAVVRRPSFTFHFFDLSSETAERNSTKLDWKQDVNVLYKVCVFQADRKNKLAALASDWLMHFRLLLWNRWTEFIETR